MKSAPSLFLFFTGLVILMPTGVMSNFIFARNASDSLPSSPCAFSLSASAPFNSTLWQFPDGQIRLNGSYDKATFLIDEDGGLTDTRGFGCFIGDLPAAQIRCAQRRKPLVGFSIDGADKLTFRGSETFYACPGFYGEYGLASQSYLDPDGCIAITLQASSGCGTCPQAASTVWETSFSTTTVTATSKNYEVVTTQDCSSGCGSLTASAS